MAELETLLLSDTTKITELGIHRQSRPSMGLTRALQALERRPTLTKLGLYGCRLSRDDPRELGMCNNPSLQSLVLTYNTLVGYDSRLVPLAPAIYRNTSIKVLDLSHNNFHDMNSAAIVQDILRSNESITTLDLSWNLLGTSPDLRVRFLPSYSTRPDANILLVSCSLCPDSLDVFGDDLNRFCLYLLHIHVALRLLYWHCKHEMLP